MKKIILATIVMLFAITLTVGQEEITGKWNGVLNIPGSQLRLVLDIEKTNTGFMSTLYSLDQGGQPIPVTTTTFENSILIFKVVAIGASYQGKLVGASIKGDFIQGGLNLPLVLSREESKKVLLKRPQEPQEPFSYYSEEVTFKNEKAAISLSGTLTLPRKEGKYPAVILITGSGPQDRNEELAGHKPFLVISDYLTKKGIAVLRYDDRGFGKSTGDFKAAISEDFAVDVESAISYLKTRKEIHKNKIGLVGHSEGGLIAPMVAAKSKDVNFIVLLAGPGIPGDQLLLLQGELIEKAMGRTAAEIKSSKEMKNELFKMITNSKDVNTLKKEMNDYLLVALKNDTSDIPKGMSVQKFVSNQIKALTNLWMINFIKYDPAIALEKVKCAVLAVNGEKDLQVPPKENLGAISSALKKGGNKKVTLIAFPKLNHLFQESETGSPMEYEVIEETFSEEALAKIAAWIQKQVK